MITRKPNRLKDYDYSTDGAYFITLCTQNRRALLSNIVGDGLSDVPHRVHLLSHGKIADRYIRQMSDFYNNLTVEHYVIMPNHIHMLIRVEGNGSSRTPTPTNSVIAKFVGTLKRFCNRELGEQIWQRSYYDHVIRDETDYLRIAEYIQKNPARWREDRFYTDA